MPDPAAKKNGAPPGRQAPHNMGAEESLLGAMLLSTDAIAAAVETVRADDFYRPTHGHIFDAICTLYAAGEKADPVTVGDQLARAGLLEQTGGVAALLSMQVHTPATSNAGRYARIVEEMSVLRRLIGVGGEISDLGYAMPDDVADALDRAEALVFDIAERQITDTTRPLHDLLNEAIDRLGALYERDETVTGVPTGFTDLDETLLGLQKSSLYIVGARPGAGKTAMALGIAAHAAMEAQTPVLFFSLEMSHPELTSRLLSSEARVDSTRIRNGKLWESDWNKISLAVGRLGEAPIYIDDNPNLTVMDIRAKARRVKSRVDTLGLIVVDYLQLMRGRHNAENRQVEVSEISRSLKVLARELEVPVVALSQLSRNLEGRADKRPVLADLRESGCVAGDAMISVADGTDMTIQEIVEADKRPLVWSLDPGRGFVPAPVTSVFRSGDQAVWIMGVGDSSIVATGNHQFYTLNGWRRLDCLRPGDYIAGQRPALSVLPLYEPGKAEWLRVGHLEPAGITPTFDLTVDGTHNFIANGIVAHNSLEQDSDVVLFIYRDELYNEDTADKGIAEIIIAKHRNGPTGMVQLAFLDHFTRFANMARV